MVATEFGPLGWYWHFRLPSELTIGNPVIRILISVIISIRILCRCRMLGCETVYLPKKYWNVSLLVSEVQILMGSIMTRMVKLCRPSICHYHLLSLVKSQLWLWFVIIFCVSYPCSSYGHEMWGFRRKEWNLERKKIRCRMLNLIIPEKPHVGKGNYLILKDGWLLTRLLWIFFRITEALWKLTNLYISGWFLWIFWLYFRKGHRNANINQTAQTL